MISAPKAVQEEWLFLENNHVGCSPEFWKFWEENWLPTYNDIVVLLREAPGESMSVSKGQGLNILIKDLHRFLDFQRNTENDRFHTHKTIKSLMTHYINNSLHKIGFMADVGGSNPEPITPDNVKKITVCVYDMFDFWERLRRIN